MYSSQYDSGAFVSSQSTQSPDSSIAKNRGYRSTTIPLTVKQITDAYESSSQRSELIIDGVDVGNIVLAGMVCNKASRATDVTFTLDDGTGRMDFIRWSTLLAIILFILLDGQLIHAKSQNDVCVPQYANHYP